MGSVNEGVIGIVAPPTVVVLPPGAFTEKAAVVPTGLAPLQSKTAPPDEPDVTEARFDVRVVQLLVMPDTAVIAGKVCVKRVVAA